MRIEKNKSILHKKIFILPGFEYEIDYDDRYINIYFLYWKFIFRFRRK